MIVTFLSFAKAPRPNVHNSILLSLQDGIESRDATEYIYIYICDIHLNNKRYSIKTATYDNEFKNIFEKGKKISPKLNRIKQINCTCAELNMFCLYFFI